MRLHNSSRSPGHSSGPLVFRPGVEVMSHSEKDQQVAAAIATILRDVGGNKPHRILETVRAAAAPPVAVDRTALRKVLQGLQGVDIENVQAYIELCGTVGLPPHPPRLTIMRGDTKIEFDVSSGGRVGLTAENTKHVGPISYFGLSLSEALTFSTWVTESEQWFAEAIEREDQEPGGSDA